MLATRLLRKHNSLGSTERNLHLHRAPTERWHPLRSVTVGLGADCVAAPLVERPSATVRYNQTPQLLLNDCAKVRTQASQWARDMPAGRLVLEQIAQLRQANMRGPSGVCVSGPPNVAWLIRNEIDYEAATKSAN